MTPMAAGRGTAGVGLVSVGVSIGTGVMRGTGVGVAVGTGVAGTLVVTGMKGVFMVVGRGSGITGAGVGGKPRTSPTSSLRSIGFSAVMWNCCVAVAEEVRNRTTPYPLASVLTSA